MLLVPTDLSKVLAGLCTIPAYSTPAEALPVQNTEQEVDRAWRKDKPGATLKKF